MAQAVAPGTYPVAEGGEQRLHIALPHDVVVEDIVHDLADVLEHIAAGDVGLIPLGGAGDVEIVALAAVELRIHPVQGEGDLGHDVGPQRRLRPGGVQLVRGHILDVAGEGHRYIGGAAVGQAQMDGDGGGDHRIDRHGPDLLTV